ncbi:hypothetical protein [Botrimarina mediterranea]|uniref:Uncharacterized protein n=1 Tax=Botrimarina mediterranea TaxID=2528022 RepID=A0A518K614_9BACT|nr:hypothetical protein [Botrimarina mediterranea]QDV73217.1 hypothetical protein Spa11_14130 [Botrimarina mediterranea]
MNLLLHLPPELEARLTQQARSTGQNPEEIALRVLEEQLVDETLATASLSADDWVSDVRSWAESHRTLSQEADDSRESIYAGRGE